jgi:mRNA interferase MazF
MAVTSQMLGDLRTDDVPIIAWEAAGLLKPSAIKPVIATLEQSLIIRKLGTLDGADSAALQTALNRLLTL